jgi:hypothetical protein
MSIRLRNVVRCPAFAPAACAIVALIAWVYWPLPWVPAEMLAHWRNARLVAVPVALVWLGLAVVAIRVTTPLWGDELV